MTMPTRRALLGIITAGGLAAGGGALAFVATDTAHASGSGTQSGTASARTGTAPGAGKTSACPRPGGAGFDGRITAVGANSITVRDPFGTSRTYTITAATAVHEGPRHTLGLSALASGEHVMVRASSRKAQDIDVHPASIDGSVASVDGATITVTDRDGFTRMIATTSATTYTRADESATRSAVQSGSVVHAEGTVDSNGTTLDATKVQLRTAADRPRKPIPPKKAGPLRPARGPGCGPARGGHGPKDGARAKPASPPSGAPSRKPQPTTTGNGS